jgi:hypothetical protein
VEGEGGILPITGLRNLLIIEKNLNMQSGPADIISSELFSNWTMFSDRIAVVKLWN